MSVVQTAGRSFNPEPAAKATLPATATSEDLSQLRTLATSAFAAGSGLNENIVYDPSRGFGLCQAPSAAIRASASFGPQLLRS